MAIASCRCDALRRDPTTLESPGTGYESTLVECRDPRYFVRCRSCGSTWVVRQQYDWSDNSTPPMSDGYAWTAEAWTDADLAAAQREGAQLRVEREHRHAQWLVERESAKQREAAEEEERRAEEARARPRRLGEREWAWGKEPQQHLVVHDDEVTIETTFPDGYGWSFDDFIAGLFGAGDLPGEVREQALQVIRKIREK